MKKNWTLLSAAALCFMFANGAGAKTGGADKLDLPLLMLAGKPEIGKAMLGKVVSDRGGESQVDVLVKSSDVDLTIAQIEEAGGSVRSVLGNIMTAFVPLDFLQELAQKREVQAIEASKQLHLLMDSARANAAVDSLQSTSGNSDGIAYDGRNVVVGAIDSGLDYSRNDFNNSSGTTRVQYLNFQTISSGSLSSTECVKSQISDGSCTIASSNDSSVGHGTHVMGIAAGNNSTYKGVANESDIMLVRNDFADDTTEGSTTFSGSLLDGTTAIFKKADTIDKPAVINISQGTHIGAHDDTSLMEQGLNAAVAGQYDASGKSYGRVIVAAAGNEHVVLASLDASTQQYAGGIHAAVSVANGSSMAWRLWVLGEPTRDPLVIDAWFSSGQKDYCTVSAKGYNYARSFLASLSTTNALIDTGDLPLSTDNSGTAAQSTDGKVGVVAATDASDSQNNKPRALFTFGPSSTGSWTNITPNDATQGGYVLDIIVRASGATCSGNIWIEGGGTSAHFLKNIDTSAFTVATGTNGDGYSMQAGDNNYSVGLPGTASGVIAVGAYLQEKPYGSGGSHWTDTNGTSHDATDVSGESSSATVLGGTVGSRTPFSSIGPTADGRTKPEVLAPGDPIISVLPSGYSASTAVTVDSTHYKSQGTSQAAPFVAGLVALLLQKNNTLTAAEVKTALTTSSSQASSPDSSNGYGKVRGTSAMAAISTNTSGYSGTGDVPDNGGGNGNGGDSSSGCGNQITPAADTGQAGLILAFLILPALLLASRRGS